MAILGTGRMPANTAGAFASTANRTGNSMGIDYAKLAQMDAERNAMNKTAGGSAAPQAGGSAQAEAAWQEAMRLLQREGPLNAGVQQQMINRRADQSAAAEAVNADQIRNEAAARGVDPTQALRQAQQQRQASNVAFGGDLRSQAAVQNFAAETPGRMAAAQANLMRTFTGASTPAVSGGVAFGGAPRTTASPLSGGGYNPGLVHQQAQQQPMAFAPSKLYGAKTTATPQAVTKPVMAPAAPAAAPTAFGQPIYKTQAQQSALQNALNSKTFLTPQQASDSWATYR